MRILSFFLLSLFVFSVFSMSGQDAIHPQTIVMKLRADKAHLAAADGITHPALTSLLQELDVYAYERLFPRHSKPEKQFDEYGNPLVDLSLIYQFKYRRAMDENLLAQKLQSTGLFAYVTPRPLNHVLYVPDDSLITNQYHLTNIKAYEAWDIETGDSTIVIGITDTGTDRVHEDLGRIAFNENDTLDGIDNDNDGFVDNYYGWDMGSNDNNPQWYPTGHGAFTTGVSSATPDNGKGIAGTGYNSRYLPIKVDDTTGILTRDYEAVVYAADHGCAIVNCSWGGRKGSPFGQDIVNYATFNRNALVVAACGNSYNDEWLYPASYDNVLSVGGTNNLDERWIGASWGTKVDLCAPAQAVYSSWPFNGYFASSGTSFAAPAVAGAAALLKAHFPSLTALQIGEQLRVTCDSIDTIAFNQPQAGQLGSGRLNMYRALTDTLSPSVRLRNVQVDRSNDTLYIGSEFFNYLRPTSATAYAVLRSNSPYLVMVDSMHSLANLAEMSFNNNYAQPFSLEVLPATPDGYQHDIAVHFYDTAYHGLEYIRLEINPDFLDLDTNLIHTTITSISRLGYTENDLSQGSGFRYRNSDYMFKVSGLLIGNSANRVSDNIYKDSGFDEDYESVERTDYVLPAVNGDQQIEARFTDAGAGSSRMHVEVTQNAYAFDAPEYENLIVLDYTIVNEGFSIVRDVYVAYFIDWDLDILYKNRAAYDSAHALAYAFPVNGGVTGGIYGGLQALAGENPKAYVFNNDGSEQSLNFWDGFTEQEKFTAMSTRRDSAGFDLAQGVDVSTLVSFGPYQLDVGDTAHVTFVVMAGDHLTDLQDAAQSMRDLFFPQDTTSIHDVEGVSSFVVYPNPVTDRLNMDFELEGAKKATLQITDIQGKMLYQSEEHMLKQGSQSWSVDVGHLENGVYLVRFETGQSVLTKRFVLSR